MSAPDFVAACAALERARTVTVLTGAGVSTPSGIPDYRGPQGVWTRDPEAEKMATLHHYLEDPEVRRRSWRNRLTSPIWRADPNPAHQALAALEATHDVLAVITQNVDGLHQKAGSSPEKVIELHGNSHATRCWSCGDVRPMDEAIERVKAGEEDPRCRSCGTGILKSTTVSFGENLDPGVIGRAEEAARRAELLLVAGSSLSVYPAAALVPTAYRSGATVVIANAQQTPYDDLAVAVLRDPLQDALPALVRECRPLR